MAKSLVGAAASLKGLVLDTGWKVVDQLSPGRNSTGGTFSHSYHVERGAEKGFLKAFDFSDAFEPGEETIEFLKLLTSAYEHERDLLTLCRQGRMSHVVVAIEHGNVQVPTFDLLSGRVYYIIFEMADGDVRRQMDLNKRFDTGWSLRALRDVCLGLSQVHRQMIAHQDIKPSNVLAYGKQGFRISDFGRASLKGRSAPHDGQSVAGDRSYAPPELLYEFISPDFGPRRMGCDVYMLGNLASFMFTGANITASILSRLDPQFHPNKWNGTYEQVLPYVEEAFSRTLAEIEKVIDPLAREFTIRLIRETCNPNLARRGHSRGVGGMNQYSLERYVQQLEAFAFRYNIERRAAAQT